MREIKKKENRNTKWEEGLFKTDLSIQGLKTISLTSGAGKTGQPLVKE